MIIPMIIIDMVNSLKAQFQFRFNLIIKSVEDNSEPFVMGNMGLEEVNDVIQRELAKLAATQNISPTHSANASGTIPAAPATPTNPRPPRTGAILPAPRVAEAPAASTPAPPNDVLRDFNSINASRSLSDDSALFYMRREEQEVLPAADQDQEMVDEHDQRRVSPVWASPPEY